ncbi:MAG: hypothetical protein A2Y16_06875 [Tenericutes bacterium GWF2_57_13]|nr:MAG: hypothetical protein A2Y16_06875 [Tenericutes bacterium GWF2_57_13]
MGNFGSKHLLGLAWLLPSIAILLVVLLVLRKKKGYGESFDRKVILGASIFIWVWEIIKTIFIFNSPAYGSVGVYTAYMLPFHICSMALYAYPVIAGRHHKLAEFVKPFAFAVTLLVTAILLVVPDFAGILGNLPNWSFVYDNILPFQSFSYHGTLLFVPLYMVLSGFYRPRLRDIGKATVVFVATAIFAITMNKLFLGVTDFMTLEHGWGNPFNYLIADRYWLYFLILAGISVGGSALTLGIAELIWKLSHRPAK